MDTEAENSNHDDSSPDDDVDVPEEELPRASSSKGFLWLGILLVGLGAFAGVGKLSGTGWFGYRDWMYEGGELYVLNMNEEPVLASVDGFEDVEIPLLNAQRLDLVGGTSEIIIKHPTSGKVLETHEVTLDGSHAILKVAPGEECFAVVDVSAYYRGQQGARPIVLDKITKDQKLHVIGSRNVIWPRKPFPKKIDPAFGPARWVSIVGCDLFDDEEYLEGYLDFQIQEGFRKAKEKEQNAQPVRQVL